MKLPRRTVLKSAAGMAAASMLTSSSVGQGSGTPAGETRAEQPPLPPVHFSNLNRPQRHQYTGASIWDIRRLS
jgi:hypothetical protein